MLDAPIFGSIGQANNRKFAKVGSHKESEPNEIERAVKARLDALVLKVGGPTEMIKRTGISSSSFYRYLQGNAPPLRILTMIAEASDVPLEWLISGERAINIDSKNQDTSIDDSSDVVMIPLASVAASAGHGCFANESSKEKFPFLKSGLRKFGINPANVEFVRIKGDSMEPTIKDGAVVLLDRSKTEIHEDAIYILSLGEYVRVKRVLKKTDGTISLISDNKSLYPEETIDRAEAERLIIHGRVFWTERSI